MAVRKYKSRKKQKVRLPLLFAGLLLMIFAFFIALKELAEPIQSISQVSAQEQHDTFIEKIAPQAQELQQGYGVLPSIIIGQAILESNWGKSSLAADYNNLFGVKAGENQKSVSLETKEFYNEQWVTIKGDFRVYDSWADSLDDHTKLFVNGTTWNPAQYEKVLTAQNYQEAAQALQDSGYATDPDYAQKIISVIESYSLDRYDSN